MANSRARGIDPMNIMEKILQTRILRNAYWKEHCFGLTEESLAERAIELDHFGGTFGGNKTPTPFICLILAMLQMQPDQEIVLEFIQNEDYKYVRALGAFYLRLVGQARDIYRYLEPLLMDLRKLRKRTDTGFVHVHMDAFVEELLSPANYSCDLTLPFLARRPVLEENGDFPPRESALQGTEDAKIALAPWEAATQRAAKRAKQSSGSESDSDSDSDSGSGSGSDSELESNYRERVKRERWRKSSSSSSSRRHSPSRSPNDRRSRHSRGSSRSPRRSPRRHSSRERRPDNRAHDRRDRESYHDRERNRDRDGDRDRYSRRRSPSPRYSRSRQEYDRRDRDRDHRRRSGSRSPSSRDRHHRRSRQGPSPTPYDRPRGRGTNDRRPDRQPERKEARPSSSSKGDISLSVEETNKMRASLGLPPLK